MHFQQKLRVPIVLNWDCKKVLLREWYLNQDLKDMRGQSWDLRRSTPGRGNWSLEVYRSPERFGGMERKLAQLGGNLWGIESQQQIAGILEWQWNHIMQAIARAFLWMKWQTSGGFYPKEWPGLSYIWIDCLVAELRIAQ